MLASLKTSTPRRFKIIVACQKGDMGIGYQGHIPWKIPNELKLFKKITTTTEDPNKRNVIIMGKNTYQSIGKVLPDRLSIVVSSTLYAENDNQLVSKESSQLLFAPNLDFVFNTIDFPPEIENIFFIGGAQLYQAVMENKEYQLLFEGIYLSIVNTNHQCDCFFKTNIWEDPRFIPTIIEETEDYTCTYYRRYYNRDETQYLMMIYQIIQQGDPRQDRTQVGTLALFGQRMEFDISERFPLLTTKRVPWKTVLRELLWFLSGSTDATILQAKKVRIWDGNTSREFLDNRGLNHLPVGDIGSGYGHQWRHFGAPYKTCKDDYTGQGVDQIQAVIDLIKNDPTSRRIVLSAWNPAQQSTMSLPPCHILVQFFVRANQLLDCQLYQRSGDMGLGVPFNIASYSFLTYMVAHVTGLKPGKFIHVIGDAHVYNNHIEPLKEQLEREPYRFPKLEITRKVDNIFDFKEEDFQITEYNYYPTIKMEMAV